MITGELKSKVDSIWDTMWSGGVSNPLAVIEQLTYLLFPESVGHPGKYTATPAANAASKKKRSTPGTQRDGRG